MKIFLSKYFAKYLTSAPSGIMLFPSMPQSIANVLFYFLPLVTFPLDSTKPQLSPCLYQLQDLSDVILHFLLP